MSQGGLCTPFDSKVKCIGSQRDESIIAEVSKVRELERGSCQVVVRAYGFIVEAQSCSTMAQGLL